MSTFTPWVSAILSMFCEKHQEKEDGWRAVMTGVALCPLGDQYALKMRLVDHVYDDQVIDSLTVKIILPEGAR